MDANDFSQSPDVSLEVDTRGKPRPMPTMGAVKGLDLLNVGDVMEIFFDDPACITDLQNWAKLKHQEFLGSRPIVEGYGVRIRRLS